MTSSRVPCPGQRSWDVATAFAAPRAIVAHLGAPFGPPRFSRRGEGAREGWEPRCTAPRAQSCLYCPLGSSRRLALPAEAAPAGRWSRPRHLGRALGLPRALVSQDAWLTPLVLGRALVSVPKRRPRGCVPAAKVKAYELRSKSKEDLKAQLRDLKVELGGLRVAKVTGGAQNKLAKARRRGRPTPRSPRARRRAVLAPSSRVPLRPADPVGAQGHRARPDGVQPEAAGGP